MSSVETAQERRSRSDRRRVVPPLIAADLREAIEREEIEILFQPQFVAADWTLTGAEALARWQHPGRGRIGGETLFAIAARSGLVERLSRHVARAALRFAVDWPAPLHLSLNVTAADVAARDFAATMTAAVSEACFPPERLTLEITEQALVADLDRTAERLRQLADLGIRIALDDFGAGFCNFDYLKRLPIHAIKLDRRMIDGIVEHSRDLDVLRAILAMAQALGLDVVAEGVEHEAQRAAIAREGCAAWQGFLGAKPMSAADFAEMTARG